MRLFRNLPFLLLFSAISFGVSAQTDQDEINEILKLENPPFGVVFEIAKGDRSALQWAIPAVKNYAQQLRDKFPQIGIAVVSHGKEQFALMKSEQNGNEQVHQTVKSLVADDIPVHVCGTHASWFNKSAEDFPDYVNVAPAGPTEINNYVDMGYIKIVLDGPKR